MLINFLAQIKSYSFWLSLASACLLLLQAVGKPLGLEINEEVYMSIINGILGIFVVLGIVTYPNVEQNQDKDDNIDVEQENKKKDNLTEQQSENLCDNENIKNFE